MAALSDQELESLLCTGEADCVERKRNASDLDRVQEAVCAFANDLPDRRLPGVVFIGVEDDGSCAQLPITDELLTSLGQIRDDGGITPFPSMEVRRAVLSGCALAVIIVQPSDNPPIRTRGRSWLRVGPRRAITTPDEERRLVEKRRWGNLPFDAQPVPGAGLTDLDLNRFRLEYLSQLISPDTIAQNERTTDQQLRALRLIDANQVPTTTAILMLGKSPQGWFPGACIAWRKVGGLGNAQELTNRRRLRSWALPLSELAQVDRKQASRKKARITRSSRRKIKSRSARTRIYALRASKNAATR